MSKAPSQAPYRELFRSLIPNKYSPHVHRSEHIMLWQVEEKKQTVQRRAESLTPSPCPIVCVNSGHSSSPNHLNDINVCILENYPECSNPKVFYIIPYFCGQHPKCREPGLWALERAKQNILENYLLVGVLEELEDVLLLLERLLPHYFSGVLGVYKSTEFRKMANMTGTVRKHTPTLEALQVLYHRMRYEYDFYNFIRDQFHLVKKKIGLRSVSRAPAHSSSFLRELELRTAEPLDDDEDLDADLEAASDWLVQP
ncbi:uronyl 2-sulfotransferase a [Aplochiton taeniatus]